MRLTLDQAISYLKDPISLAIAVLILSIVISTCGMSLGWFGLIETYDLFPWMISAAMLLYYSFFTAVILMVTRDSARDWGRAIYGFMGFVILSGLYAWWLSGHSIYDARTYQSIYIVLTLAFFVFLSIGTTVKFIVDFTHKRDAQANNNTNTQENQ